MKKIIILSSLLGVLFTANSCRQEFLESAPTETLSVPSAQAKLYGLYTMMVSTGTGGTDLNHDDFGQKSYDVYMDLLSGDMALEGVTYNWYSRIADLTGTSDFTAIVNYMPWRYYYRIAYAANDVIAGLGGNDAVPASAGDKAAMGQAKAMRAYAYFYLTQLYTTKYDPSADAVPLYTTTSVVAQPKAKQSLVYAQIVKDLSDAVSLLNGYSRPNKGVINKSVAQGLLAYTYAAMGQNDKAAALSEEIITNGGFAPTSRTEVVYDEATAKGGGFNDLSTGSWMWGFDISSANDLDLISWWGQMDVFTYSYAWAGDAKGIDLDLYAQIKDGDVRKRQFVTVTQTDPDNPKAYSIAAADKEGDYQAVPANKFFHQDRAIGSQRTISSDYLFMRVDEFYLLAAETYAKTGNEAKAKQILKNFLANRLDNTSYIDRLSGAALQNEIYLQTRIELWGEGKAYLAMKRNRASVKRGANHLYFVGQTMNYDDPRLSLRIPQSEINNNPKL